MARTPLTVLAPCYTSPGYNVNYDIIGMTYAAKLVFCFSPLESLPTTPERNPSIPSFDIIF